MSFLKKDGGERPARLGAHRLLSCVRSLTPLSGVLILYDMLSVTAAYFLALWVRFDFQFSTIDRNYLDAWAKFAPLYAVLCVAVFFLHRMYQSVWRYASYTELMRILEATMATVLFHAAAITLVHQRMPISYYFLGAVFQFLLTLFSRFSYRFLLLFLAIHANNADMESGRRVMLIGAGSAGQMILRDTRRSEKVKDRIVCIIDDDQRKWGRDMEGVPIVGGRDDIMAAAERYKVECIFVAIPSARPQDLRDVLDVCKETGCELRNLPGVYQFLNDEIRVSAMREVAIEDLLGRDVIQVDMGEIFTLLTGKTILVTGGGGSIGSELCRQIAGHKPKNLIIFDSYENNAYEIQQELLRKDRTLNLTVLIGSVRDSRRVYQVFETYRPEIVFHAAAHKHVPLMEVSPNEAVKNNVIGTYKTAYAAMCNGCKRFVLISTDKAVNPTNIMGASKRMCEMIVQSFDQKVRSHRENELPELYTHKGEVLPHPNIASETEFVAVRFGNVLGSNGSVIPLFKKQIAEGGPVTVTHPEIQRYFMTIPEAVSLVLQAGTYAQGGEIFVLDMGDPVKIDTLARNLIKLSGLKPDVDIMVKYSGLRPGEKLYEEKLMAEEGLKTTPNHLIHIGNPIPFDVDQFVADLVPLMDAAYNNVDDITERVEALVDTFHPVGDHPEVQEPAVV